MRCASRCLMRFDRWPAGNPNRAHPTIAILPVPLRRLGISPGRIYVHKNVFERRLLRISRRRFAWRNPLLAALRQNPKMVTACRAAQISRNTVYTHLRRDAGFRRQWENAVDEGWAEVYRHHQKLLAVDPKFQAAMQRAADALQYWESRANGITHRI